MTKLALIIIHYGSPETTRKCLTSLQSKIGSNQLILINNTPEDIGELVKLIPHTQLIDNQANLGFAKAVNQGITLAITDPQITHFFLLNNDAQIEQGTLAQLARTYGKHKSAGIISPVLHYESSFDWGGRFNKWTGMVKHLNWENRPKTVLKVDHAAAAAMLISRTLVEQIGLFDERFFLYYEDLDYCLRAKDAGYSIHINPAVVVDHQLSASSNLLSRTYRQWRSHLLFIAKYLPKRVLPTALIVDIFLYPLFILKSLLRKR